jgi:hypothetical protein
MVFVASCGAAPESLVAVDDQASIAMNESEFWGLIAKLDWKHTGDDEAVCRPVVKALAAQPLAAIRAFEEILAQRLHALDTEAHAREIGGQAYTGAGKPFSPDWFLYVRCCVVANGESAFEAVLKNPKRMFKDIEFEALLQIAADAHRAKTGQDFEFRPSVSYETFSNQAGWQREEPAGALPSAPAGRVGKRPRRPTVRRPNRSAPMTTAEKQLASLFAKYDPAMAKLGKALRIRLRARLRGLTEIVYLYEGQGALVISYSPTDRGYQAVCSLALYADHAKLHFANGAQLAKADPAKLLQGRGSVRHVVLHTVADFDRDAVAALVAAGCKIAKLRLDAGAKGAILFKVEEQQQRARRAAKTAASPAKPSKANAGRAPRKKTTRSAVRRPRA